MQRYLIGLLGVLALLTACGGADDRVELGEDSGTGAAAVELGSADGDGPAPAGDVAGDQGAATAAPGEVQTVQAGEAGEVDVRIIGGRRLELVEVREADGWTSRVDDLAQQEIELDFRHTDGRALELEIEIEDGRLRVEAH